MPVLQFKGKTAVENYHYTVPHHALEFDPKLSVLAKGDRPSLEGNLIIEGDNLLALKALLPTHAGRIKCIYIDPPYNTGNEGWVYNDNLTQPQFKEWIGQTVGKEAEDACRHDKWCCMMYPRLQLLKELLADDGVILVSIDDNEVHNLRIMMDEIFGNGPAGDPESNFMGAITWRTRNTDNRVTTRLSVDHEFVLAYRKTQDGALNGRIIDRSDFTNPDNDPRGPYVTDPLTGKATAAKRPNLHFAIVNPKTEDRFEPDPSRGWITDREGIGRLIDEDRIWWPQDLNTGKPRKKRFLAETRERMPESTFWTEVRGQSGADEVDQILGKRLFDFPKLADFMVRLIDIASAPDAIVLDCTAGSGTTAHAVLSLNKGGASRIFIAIQHRHDTKQHEKDGLNICERVTAARLKAAMAGYSFRQPKRGGGEETIKVPAVGGSFTYARLGEPLFGEYKVWNDKMPAAEELAKYIFYTETSREFQPKEWHKKTGRIGEHKQTAYYLLYAPDDKAGHGLDTEWLATIGAAEKCKRLVVYCEKIWLHREDREKWERQTGKSLRAMQLPMGLK